MLKDIPELKVENVEIAIVEEENELAEKIWNVYFINMKDETLETVLVTSKGYGSVLGEEVKTSALRHLLGDVEPHSFALVEPIMDNLFVLNNEFWISFFLNGNIYDKKFVFEAETIVEKNLTTLPLIGKRGIILSK
ncbi:MAG: hypothetical protein WCL14_05030 [Bacteroidota bacterium]